MKHKIQAFEVEAGMGDPGPHSLRLPLTFFLPYLPVAPKVPPRKLVDPRVITDVPQYF